MYIWMFIIGTVATLIVIYLVNQSKDQSSYTPTPRPPVPRPPAPRPRPSSSGFTMNQINQMSETERRNIADAIGCDVYNLSSIDNLAISTILIEKTIKLSATDSYLCKSPLCSCDTTIFTLFVVRALSLHACPTREKAQWFSDYYVPLVIKGIELRYGSSIPQLTDMIENRTEFYDRVLMSKSSLGEGLNAIFEEFEYVIKTDIIQKTYSPFSEKSPLPLLGMPEDHSCQIQISNFCKNILRFLAPYYNQMMNDMNV